MQDCQDFGSGPVKKDAGKQTAEESALPLLLNCEYRGLESALQPRSLGWINYWSQEVSDYLGFPDPSRDAPLLLQSALPLKTRAQQKGPHIAGLE